MSEPGNKTGYRPSCKAERIPKLGCFGIIAVLVLLFLTINPSGCHKDTSKETQYGPEEVLKELPFTLKPGEYWRFEAFDPKTGDLFRYTTKWVKYSTESLLDSYVCGRFGIDGDDQINGSEYIHPGIGGRIVLGGVPNTKVYYAHLQNIGPDTVEGVVKLWGRKVISP